MSARQSQAEAFRCIRLHAPDALRAECALAEAFAAGAAGVEEELDAGRVTFAVYASAAAVDRVRAALAISGVEVLSVSPVPSRDWSEAWKENLGPIVVSTRLVVRPSFAAFEAGPGQCVLEIDPAQAFGTGSHESTRLALEGVDWMAPHLGSDARLLDVGTGTGVLALAALGLGCGRAVALDLDPLAGQAARVNAARNRLADRLDVFVGGVEALGPRRFGFVTANLLSSELRPLLPAIAAHLAPGGRLVLSGLLDAQCAQIVSSARALSLELERTLRRADADGVVWAALLMRRAPAPTSR